MLRINIVTIFPEFFAAPLSLSIPAKAAAAGAVEYHVVDLRAFTHDRHRTVDDYPYGGGPGMVMKPEPIGRAIDAIRAARGDLAAVILMTPQGRRFDQGEAERISRLDRIAIVCGRYEGVDERIAATLVTDELSIGDYVLTGGELPALVVLDAVVRLVPGVVGDAASVTADSFGGGLLDYPHYTRPAVWRGEAVPEVLLSGHHAEIDKWRRRERLRRTLTRRPDLLAAADLDAADRTWLDAWREELKDGRPPAAAEENGDEGD